MIWFILQPVSPTAFNKTPGTAMISGVWPCECLSPHLSWLSLLLSISLHQIIHCSLKFLKTQGVYKEVKHPILWGHSLCSGRRQFNSLRKSPKLTRFRIIINYKDYCEIPSDKLELPRRGSDNTSATGKKQRPAGPPKQQISRPRWGSDHLIFLKETVERSARCALSFRFPTFLSITRAGVSFDDAAAFGSFLLLKVTPIEIIGSPSWTWRVSILWFVVSSLSGMSRHLSTYS